MNKILTSFSIFCLCSTLAFGQFTSNTKSNDDYIIVKDENSGSSSHGKISGKVVDKNSSESLIGLVVAVEGKAIAIPTDIDGKFEISRLVPGLYTLIFKYLSYETKVVKNIKIDAGKAITLNVEMSPIENDIKEAEVSATRVTNTESAVIAEMKRITNIVNAVSGAQISKSQDRDAAEVVKRVPGVTIMENRFLMVRGLSDRYNTVFLNDAGAPSTETDKRSFSFDVIPSGLIDRILVYKTPSADLPGDFAGGMVKIYTKTFPVGSALEVSIQEGLRAGTTFGTFSSIPGSKTDWLGFDNGYRSIPANSPNYISKSDASNSDVTKSFNNSWVITNKTVLPDQRFNLNYTNIFPLGNLRIGSTTGLFYSNTNQIKKIHRQDWDSVSQVSDYSDRQSSNTVRSGALQNFSVIYHNSKFEFKNLINQLGVTQNTLRTSNFMDGPAEKSYDLNYEARTTIQSTLGGEHKFNDDKSQYNWTLGYSEANMNQPDRKRISYTKNRDQDDSMYSAKIANIVDPINGGGRLFFKLNEKIYSFNQNFKHLFKVSDDYSFEINMGTYAEYKSREFSARVLGYTIKPGQQAQKLRRLPIEQIFAPENVGTPNGFKIDEITSKSDAYKAHNRLIANYISANLPIGKKFKFIGGYRLESNLLSLEGFVNQSSINPKQNTLALLPSANLTYSPKDQILVRLAYGKTLNRPEFRENSPFYFYDFDFRAGNYGAAFPTVLNPAGELLSAADIKNYDLRLEYYPSATEYVQIGLFYKDFTNPIQQIILNSGGSDSRAFTYTNGKRAYSGGAEVDVRKNLMFLDNMFHTKLFSRFSLVGNGSLIASRVWLNKSVNQETSSRLQGQSPYAANAGVYYQDDDHGLQSSLLYNIFGPRIFIIGTLNYANIGEMPRGTLDWTFSKKIGKRFSINGGIQNILNPAERFIQDTDRNGKFEPGKGDKEIMSYSKGSYFTLGLKVSL